MINNAILSYNPSYFPLISPPLSLYYSINHFATTPSPPLHQSFRHHQSFSTIISQSLRQPISLPPLNQSFCHHSNNNFTTTPTIISPPLHQSFRNNSLNHYAITTYSIINHNTT